MNSAQLNKFQGSQSISSDAFYGTGRQRASSGESALLFNFLWCFGGLQWRELTIPWRAMSVMGAEAAYQLQQLKSSMSSKATKLKNMTSGFFNDMQTRYS